MFFPRPGGLPANGSVGSLAEEGEDEEAPVSEIPDGGGLNNGSFRFGSPLKGAEENGEGAATSPGNTKARKSHYHKHR
jgi:hypothetical protein